MILMKKLPAILFLYCSFSFTAQSQIQAPLPDIPTMRQIFHDNIDKNQLNIIRLNNVKDTIFTPSKNADVNLQITQILKTHIDNLQLKIETDSLINTNDKYLWLRAINDVLNDFILNYKQHNIKGVLLGDVIIAFENAMNAQLKQQSIIPVINKNKIEIDDILLNNLAFKNYKDSTEVKNMVAFKLCKRNPDMILRVLTDFPDVPFADSLIEVAARRQPDELYNYAAAPNALGKKIQSSSNPLTRLITQLATSENGRQYFPFLDNLYHQKITIDSINATLKDTSNAAYYSLLVSTEIEYAGRIKNNDVPLVKNVLTAKLRSVAIDTYINEINALHDNPSDAIRFKIIDSLTPQQLYYLCVIGEEEIYTSSYLGVYKRIFERMKTPTSDVLLQSVNDDFYKKFIKMAASYNKLDDFLKKMNNPAAEQLMKNFVNNLDKTATLEDAVDVADSYASINDVKLRNLILTQIQNNLQTNKQAQNKRGKTIYQLLYDIFKSDGKPTDTALQKTASYLPPVYNMPINLLKDDSTGKIIVQQFFYGDKDGNNVFNAFIGTFANENWKTIKKPEWTETYSVKGTPIVIYSNRPLDETKDLDAMAQSDLNDYLDSLDISPTITIHRGHSYYVNSTINQLSPSSKVILLGSCGGYNNLNTVLSICPNAHIIASKQTGAGIVNIALIVTMMETLRQGKSLNWPLMWKNMQTKFTGGNKEKFDDYVPPHKNLGAIFIMAYNKKMNEENSDDSDDD